MAKAEGPFRDKLVHLDLKGAPPKVPYLLDFMKLAKDGGATGLLIEWEDAFPWTDTDLRAKTAYTEAEVRTILGKAAELKLEVVPLIQSFGHLEFVLKHRKNRNLREKAEFLMDICPLHDDAAKTIIGLFEDVLRLHPGIKRVHLGGDEVWSLASCEKCKPFADKNGKSALYLHHIEPIIKAVKEHGITPMLWDDMMRHWPVPELKRMQGTQLVVWRYGTDIEEHLPEGVWDRFAESGLTLVAASAFKGAAGVDEVWCDVIPRAQNHIAWLKRARKTKMSGIILTGWSRYNHMCCQCETLPAGTPSLLTCLEILKSGGTVEEAWAKVAPVMGLPADSLPGSGKLPTVNLPDKGFPGASLWSMSGKLAAIRSNRWHANDKVQTYDPKYNGGRRNTFEYLRAAEHAQKSIDLCDQCEQLFPKAAEGILYQQDIDEYVESKIRRERETVLELKDLAEGFIAG